MEALVEDVEELQSEIRVVMDEERLKRGPDRL